MPRAERDDLRAFLRQSLLQPLDQVPLELRPDRLCCRRRLLVVRERFQGAAACVQCTAHNAIDAWRCRNRGGRLQ